MTTDDDVDPAVEREIFADAVSGLPLVQYETSGEPVFLGKVGKLAEQFDLGLVEWLPKNRTYVVGAVVLALVWLLLRAVGIDPDLIAKLMR